MTQTNPEQWAEDLLTKVREQHPHVAISTLQAAFAEREARLVGALRAFVECARYDPHMDGSSSFIGWKHSELRRAEELARATLAALKDRTHG